MGQLVTTATIRAYDQITAPLMAMARRVDGINQRFQQGSSRTSAAMSRIGAAGAASVFGIGLLTNRIAEFEERIFGLGSATIADNMGTGTDAVAAASEEMARARQSAMDLSRELGQMPTKAAEAFESVKKAGVAQQYVADVARSIGLVQLTDKEAKTDALAEWAAAIDKIYAAQMKLAGQDPSLYFRRAADAAAVAAAKTSLATGTFREGVRQFESLTATSAGITPQQNAALLGAAKLSSDMSHIELGQTAKSMLLRTLVPTAQNVEAFAALGLNRADFIEGGGTGSASRAVFQLAAMTQGRLRGKERMAFLNEIDRAFTKGFADDDARNAWIAKMETRLGKVMGLDVTQDQNRERVTSMFQSALTSGGKVNFTGLLTALAPLYEKSSGQVARAFEQRRINLIGGLLSAFQAKEGGSEYDKLLESSVCHSDRSILQLCGVAGSDR
jgi:hypothetical protein